MLIYINTGEERWTNPKYVVHVSSATTPLVWLLFAAIVAFFPFSTSSQLLHMIPLIDGWLQGASSVLLLAISSFDRSAPTYAVMFAHPIKRQCFSILRESAIFSPISVHAGLVKLRRATSAFTPSTFAPVAVDPMFTMRTSFLVNLATFACFPSVVLTLVT